MKPRTKIEKKFAEWAGKLPPLSESQKEWAKKLFPAEALYYSRRGNNCEFHCMCCGAVVPTLGKWLLTDYAVDDWICPECGAVCKVLPQYNGGLRGNYNSRTHQRGLNPTTSRYVTLVDVFQRMQVFRTFEAMRWNGRTTLDGKVCGMPTEFHFYEIYQNWVTDDGGEMICTKPYTRGFNHFTWDYNGPWGVGHHNAHCSGYYQFDDVFTTEGNWVFPRPRVSKMLRRNGFDGKLVRCARCDLARLAVRILTDNSFEEIVKLGQLATAGYFLDRVADDIGNYIHAVRICSRNGYKITDANLWVDYIDDLEFLGLDTHNAHYVCPQNLMKAHETMQRRRERIERKKEEEKRRKEAAKWEKRYAEAKAPFLGIVFGDKNIVISVIQTVADVAEEGAAMHHCVFANGYYKRPDRVLLSARDKNGNRLETVEIGLDPYKVLQSRGLQNGSTKQHKRIVALCEANMDAFKKAVSQMTIPLHKLQA